jgi:ribosomal-protein-serine acetyltransferase
MDRRQGAGRARAMNNEYRSLVLAAGEKFRLVPYDVSFSESLFEAVEESRDELLRWTSWCSAEYTMEDSRRWLQSRERYRFEGRAYDFAVTDAKTGELVGGCGIERIERENRIGRLYYWVRNSRRRQGAASEAAQAVAAFGLNNLQLIRLEAIVSENNLIGQRVAEKIGASREIRLRNRVILSGKIQHAYLFALFPE